MEEEAVFAPGGAHGAGQAGAARNAGPGGAGARGRGCALRRLTRETRIAIALDPDCPGGPASISTGIGFLDHLLGSLATHAGWSLRLECAGDLGVDDHHSAEDCAILLGEALARAVGKGPAIRRFGHAYAPLDEALARAVVDFSGRPWAEVDLGLSGPRIGGLAAENVSHFLESLALTARMNLHVDVLRGRNDHHRAEAAFKALALALRSALEPALPAGAADPGSSREDGKFRSTKGGVILEEIAFEAAVPGAPGGGTGGKG